MDAPDAISFEVYPRLDDGKLLRFNRFALTAPGAVLAFGLACAISPGIDFLLTYPWALVVVCIPAGILWAVLRFLGALLNHTPSIHLQIESGALVARLVTQELTIPLEQLRVGFDGNVLSLQHPGGIERLHPIDPSAIEPFAEMLAARVARHGSPEDVPAALREHA